MQPEGVQIHSFQHTIKKHVSWRTHLGYVEKLSHENLEFVEGGSLPASPGSHQVQDLSDFGRW